MLARARPFEVRLGDMHRPHRLVLAAWLAAAAACGDADEASDQDETDLDATASPGDPASSDDTDPDGADEPWTNAPPVLGGAIQETAAVSLAGKIYVLGGFTGSGTIVPAVRMFDVATGQWSDGPNLPRPIHHANVAVVDDSLYVVGALEGSSFDPIGDVWSWTPATETAWTARTSMPAGTERGASVVGAIDGVIYVAGGLRSGAVTDLSAFTPATDEWNLELPPLPAARDHGCGGVVDGVLYVTGGRDSSITSTSDAVFGYRPGSEWDTRAPMPTGRGGTACGVVDDRIVVVGGEGNPNADSGVFPEVEAFAPATNAWESLTPMTTPRHGMAAAAWDGKLYVPGGATQQGFGAVNTHEVLTP